MKKEENIQEDLLKPVLLEDLGYIFLKETNKKPIRGGLYRCGLCGKEFKTHIYNVEKGIAKSCGCLKERVSKEGTNIKHRLTHTRLYRIWGNMKRRILNPKFTHYFEYGGRGISICEEWKNDFMSFYDWAMSNGYSDELSIDRIDNDGNYEPNNCRWVTQTIQTRNQRIYKNNSSGYKGVIYDKTICKYRVRIGVNGKRIHLGYFITPEEGAIAYNNYIIENNLEGFILNEIEI